MEKGSISISKEIFNEKGLDYFQLKEKLFAYNYNPNILFEDNIKGEEDKGVLYYLLSNKYIDFAKGFINHPELDLTINAVYNISLLVEGNEFEMLRKVLRANFKTFKKSEKSILNFALRTTANREFKDYGCIPYLKSYLLYLSLFNDKFQEKDLDKYYEIIKNKNMNADDIKNYFKILKF